MGKIIADISISVDGYAAGLHPSITEPLGKGGEQLHQWLFAGKTAADNALVHEIVSGAGAVITGANTYFGAIDSAWGGVTPFEVPAFVITHRAAEKPVAGFSFVNDGIAAALKKARNAAGFKNVWVMGGASIVRQFLQEGLLDELHLHIAPVLLGGGTPLFNETRAGRASLEKIKTVDTPCATHCYFRVLK